MQATKCSVRRVPLSVRPLPSRASVSVRAREDKAAKTETANQSGDGQYTGPPQYPMYQAQPGQGYAPAPQAVGSSTPFWVWLLVGAGAMFVINKIQDFRKNPLGAMAGMMGGQAAPGAGQQDMAAMMQMMMEQQKKQQEAAANPFAGSTINTTAAEVSTPTPSNRDGSKFEQNKSVPNAASTAEAPTAPVTEQPSSTSSFFTDKSAGNAPSSFFTDAQAPPAPAGSDSSEGMVENMLMMVADNPELQKQLGQHLPESMRNESTWKWIKENPEVRKQLAQQVAPAMKSQFGDMSSFQDYASGVNSDQAMDQMKAMGVDPNEMMSKLMADPEMVQLITKPGVAEALMDMQQNPNNSFKYMSNPDIAKLMNKMVALNPMLNGAGAAPTAK